MHKWFPLLYLMFHFWLLLLLFCLGKDLCTSFNVCEAFKVKHSKGWYKPLWFLFLHHVTGSSSPQPEYENKAALNECRHPKLLRTLQFASSSRRGLSKNCDQPTHQPTNHLPQPSSHSPANHIASGTSVNESRNSPLHFPPALFWWKSPHWTSTLGWKWETPTGPYV